MAEVAVGSGTQRLQPLDALRGLIMVAMGLDHANHFVAQRHPSGEHWGGVFPAYDDPLAFLTRLVAHLSAPGFFFLMGAGMVLFAEARRKEGWHEWNVKRHFWVRGAVLIALQFLVVNRAWELSPGGWGTDLYVGVLAALGGAMILSSWLLRLRSVHLVAVTALLFVGTEILHPAASLWGRMRPTAALLLLLHSGGDAHLWSNYPLLPWVELVTFGMAFGQWLVADPQKTYRRAFGLGGVFLLAFAGVRAGNGFGNIRPRMGDSWIDLLNVVKYPPSMAFTLLTMGLNLVLLGLFGWAQGRRAYLLRPLAVFGQVPLFFYVLHLFLYAALGYLLAPSGTTIIRMYPIWLLGLAILFPLCRWYSRLKHRMSTSSMLRLL